MKQIFFQSSMPRSGSTIFQNIMAQHPDFYVTPTSGALELLFGARGNFTVSPEFKAQDPELMRKGFAGFCMSGLHGYFNAITDKKCVLDKSRGWGVYMDFVKTFWETTPKVICLVRNLHDVVCSYEKIYRKTQWLHHSVRNDLTGRGTTVHKRVDEWMSTEGEHGTIGKTVERIFEINRLNNADKVLFVKFEDLCLYPENEMTRVYEYLGIPPFLKHDFDNIEQVTQEDDSVYMLSSDLHTIKPKLLLPKSDAKEILKPDICDWIYNKYKWYYEMFNYRK